MSSQPYALLYSSSILSFSLLKKGCNIVGDTTQPCGGVMQSCTSLLTALLKHNLKMPQIKLPCLLVSWLPDVHS